MNGKPTRDMIFSESISSVIQRSVTMSKKSCFENTHKNTRMPGYHRCMSLQLRVKELNDDDISEHEITQRVKHQNWVLKSQLDALKNKIVVLEQQSKSKRNIGAQRRARFAPNKHDYIHGNNVCRCTRDNKGTPMEVECAPSAKISPLSPRSKRTTKSGKVVPRKGDELHGAHHRITRPLDLEESYK